ncbi:MFS transporter [Arthrobacter sp. STN4]|uniref:MFS transporter n=1 Tax=Arthrobacter sp. STN4 TaxID=2923276 RepID=UPI002119CF59|nr:MFS transporter [Arthrobacter sp. STN4]MCQ9165961.1 MFS transporter [Arthrobacter sp. STN4]
MPGRGALRLIDTPVAQQWSSRQLRSRRAVLLAMICIALVGGMQGVDPALHAVAMPAVAKTMHLSTSATGFLKSLGTIVLAASLLGAGIIGDRHGRKRLLVLGIFLMAVAALMSALATNPIIFGCGRVLMGAGTAMSFSMCLAITPTLYEKSKLPKAFGLFFGVGAALIVATTAVSGSVQGHFGWRATYMITAGLCVLLCFAAALVLPENRSATVRKFDAFGVLLAGAGLVSLVYSIGQAAVRGWGDPVVLGGMVLAAVVLAAFVRWERHCSDPGFPVQLFKIPAFTAACLAGVLFNWADASMLGQYPAMALPAGVPASVVSVIVALMYVGMVCGAALAGVAQIRLRLSNRCMFVSGLLLCSAGLVTQLFLRDAHDIMLPAAGLFVIGFAVMWMQNPETAVIMGSAPGGNYGAVGAVKPAVGQLGFGLGFALAAPISSIFTGGGPLTPQAYGQGLGVQALFFVAAAIAIAAMLKSRRTV